MGVLFLLVVLEPVGKLAGREDFWRYFETESLRQLYQEHISEREGLEQVLPDWDEEAYEMELEEKIQKLYGDSSISQGVPEGRRSIPLLQVRGARSGGIRGGLCQWR